MGDEAGQLNVAHALPAHLGRVTSTPHFSQIAPRCFRRLLPAQALVILDRPKMRAQKAVALGLGVGS